MSDIKLYNGDCLERMKQIPDNSIDCVVTDPPYGVSYQLGSYDDSLENVLEEMPKWYSEWHRILKEDSYLYLFVGVKTLHNWIQTGIDAGFTFKNVLAARSFNNGCPTPKNSFGFQFQPIIVFSKGQGRNYNNVDFFTTSEAWLNDKRNKNPKPYTYEYSNFIPSNICFATEKRASKKFHPNEKGVKLLKFLIEISTNASETVLDCFLGSGATGIACKKCNRSFIGIELNEKYFNIAKQRIDEED